MAPVLWSKLPADIITIISKILNTDVDTIRLRSVCSNWRSSVRRRFKPSLFPIEVPVPPLFSSRKELRKGGHYFLTYSTLYRVSPPEIGPYAGDPSDGWLLRVSEVNPNTYSLQTPLLLEFTQSRPGIIPKHLNLLDFRVSEISRGYTIDCAKVSLYEEGLVVYIRKVIVLWDYAENCALSVLILLERGSLHYWKFGDRDWTPIARGDMFDDIALCDKKCYVVSRQGVLSFVDSKFNLALAPLPSVPADFNLYDFNFVEYKSDLYVVAKFYDNQKGIPDNGPLSDDENSDEENIVDNSDKDDSCDMEGINELPFELKIFKKCNDWEQIRSFGDTLFLFCNDVSVGVSTKDFRGSKGNCVYLSPKYLLPYRFGKKKTQYGLYDLDKLRTSAMKIARDRTLICWPPPNWLFV